MSAAELGPTVATAVTPRIALLDAGATGSPRFESAFSAMLAAALAQHPTDKVVVLAGAAFRGSRKLLRIAAGRGCQIVTGTVDPWAAVERAERVYTLGGEVGFLALLAGHDVACFDDAFYSGWRYRRCPGCRAAAVPPRSR